MTESSVTQTVSASWVDFHCHLDLYPDPIQVAQEAEKNAILTLTVTTVPRAWPREREMFAHLKFVRPALGLHPELVAAHAAELKLWERHLDETRYVGEVGLDGRSRARASLPEQEVVFRRILDICAERGGKVLTVHSAGASASAVRMIATHLPPDRGRVVLHWFTGSKATLAIAVEHGCFFSINTAMLASETARKLVAAVPLDRVLTETDGPFTSQHGRVAAPTDVPHTVERLAAFLELAPTELGQRIRANLRSLLTQSSSAQNIGA
jgi:TatD DNase family protein